MNKLNTSKHVLTFKRSGFGIDDYGWAECLCGWSGPKRGNYNSYGRSMIQDDFARHKESVSHELWAVKKPNGIMLSQLFNDQSSCVSVAAEMNQRLSAGHSCVQVEIKEVSNES
jgi:hypothetical protein